jgi:hypothetical protein
VKEKIRVQDCELFEKKDYIVIFLPCAKMKLSQFFLMSRLFIEKPFHDYILILGTKKGITTHRPIVNLSPILG